MLGRLFGRTKDERDDTVCSACGRTLLAGEWTQRIVENDGSERFICSLCARPDDAPGGLLEPADEMAAVSNGRVRPARADTDAFWRALKDKDAEIERLESLLARAEAEKQELAAQLARARGEIVSGACARASVPTTAELAVPVPEVGSERRHGRTRPRQLAVDAAGSEAAPMRRRPGVREPPTKSVDTPIQAAGERATRRRAAGGDGVPADQAATLGARPASRAALSPFDGTPTTPSGEASAAARPPGTPPTAAAVRRRAPATVGEPAANPTTSSSR